MSVVLEKLKEYGYTPTEITLNIGEDEDVQLKYSESLLELLKEFEAYIKDISKTDQPITKIVVKTEKGVTFGYVQEESKDYYIGSIKIDKSMVDTEINLEDLSVFFTGREG